MPNLISWEQAAIIDRASHNLIMVSNIALHAITITGYTEPHLIDEIQASLEHYQSACHDFIKNNSDNPSDNEEIRLMSENTKQNIKNLISSLDCLEKTNLNSQCDSPKGSRRIRLK